MRGPIAALGETFSAPIWAAGCAQRVIPATAKAGASSMAMVVRVECATRAEKVRVCR